MSETYGVTVRTLHHYDQVGILCPSERSAAGYRLYTEDDLGRLQHVVVYRRLGFSLEEVAQLLADVDAQGSQAAVAHLRRQREVVRTRLAEMRDLVRAIDRAMERAMNDTPATPRTCRRSSARPGTSTRATRPRPSSAGATPRSGSRPRLVRPV